MARAQQLFIRRFLGTDSKTKTQDSASIRIQVRGSPGRVRAPHSDCIVKKAKISFPLRKLVGNKFFPLWRWLILILVVNSSLMLSLLINHYFKYGSIMWHLFLSIMINQMGTRLEYTSSCCHRFLPVTRAHGVMGRNVWNDDTLICTLIRFYCQLCQAWHLSLSQREAIVSKTLRPLQKIDKGVCPQ